MSIHYKIVGADVVVNFIKSLPPKIISIALNATADYAMGDSDAAPGRGRHGLRHDIKYKYIPRKMIPHSIIINYGPMKGKTVRGYFSSKQYYYVTWALRTGKMQIGRKNDPTNMSKSWEKSQADNAVIVRGSPPFDRFPSRHNMLAGWRHYLEVVQSNMKGAMQEAQRKVDEFIKKGTK